MNEEWEEPGRAATGTRRRHPRYFFDDGNLYIEIENILYNVHRSLLRSQEPEVHWGGRSAEYPLRPNDVRPLEFEMFLSLIYPSVPVPDDAPCPRIAEDWVAVLEQSYKWSCMKIQLCAVEQLKAIQMDDALKIAVWQKYGLDGSHVKPCYHRLATRDSPLTHAEGRLLGLEIVLRLSALRERIQQGAAGYEEMTRTECNGGREIPLQRVKDLLGRAYIADLM
ncbi:hypothetical protein L226DRAFT_470190 [Lentinus tigrinus ALCF2SS1-7]|nr:hypothetical protein L226DRAFT_470190 [Lentinus tigrinus ALCF2SS1-7]